MENTTYRGPLHDGPGLSRYYQLIVLLAASAIFLPALLSPPGLMDDVDAVQAQIARTMLESGDFITARLNGIAYLEKSPLVYWLMALSFAIFGVQDWAARIPIVLFTIALAWLTARVGAWAGGPRLGLMSGLVMATSLGLWLFTRILIPDVILTFTIALALWGFLRALDEEERAPRLWSNVFFAAMAVGLLLKGLIAVLFPAAAAFLFLAFSNQIFSIHTWRRIRLLEGLGLLVLIAAPWHIAAMLANPPLFDFTWRSVPGEYHGFFWFYFLNEHVFRFLNMRHPRDYNTFPRLAFWLCHFLWLFPWALNFFTVPRAQSPRTRRLLLLCFCWAGFLLLFFTFSTTQEYYSLPAYPALALILGLALAQENLPRWTFRATGVVAAAALVAILFLLVSTWTLPTPGDISQALRTQDPYAYTLSLGHMGDLTLASFAYLRTPLLLAGLAFFIGALGSWLAPRYAIASFALMSILFLNAARLALVTFDPFLGSRALATALNEAQSKAPGQWICDNQYYAFSSVFFYTNQRAWLLNGRVNNLEYGSHAPGAPDVFWTDAQLRERWPSLVDRYYLTVEKPRLEPLRQLLGEFQFFILKESGGKYLVSNRPLPGAENP
jgi:4-amino-4-deoxy-L-arabinose transferase-like glycosyltransferase